MGIGRSLQLVVAAPAVFSAEKSFRNNPVIGSPALNARGLHRRRVTWAARLAARRRAALASRLDPQEREAFDETGFVVRRNALPPDLFARIRRELETVPRPAWEMRQGQTVNRVMPLPVRDDGSAAAELARFLRRADVRALAGYAAGRAGHIVPMLQTIAADPAREDADPQAFLHADTFHATAKLWLFLHDVDADDGPFAFVPGSHRMTPERLAWEDREALHAARDPNEHHADGSFRIPEADLGALGYGAAQSLPVRANTLVVADTHGFHRRTPSQRPTIRVSLYGILRSNPFLPWNGLDPYDLPVLSRRTLHVYLAGQDRRARAGRTVVYVNVGPVLAADPPVT